MQQKTIRSKFKEQIYQVSFPVDKKTSKIKYLTVMSGWWSTDIHK